MAPDELSLLQQRVAVLEAHREADAERMDRMEKSIDTGFKDVKGMLQPVVAQLTELNGWMNRSKGWAAAALFLSALLGAFIKSIIAGGKQP